MSSGKNSNGDEAPASWERRAGLLRFCPHRSVAAVSEVDAEDLKSHGIKGVILDLDNTLVQWHREELSAEVEEWLIGLRKAGIKMCILSNSVLGLRSERISKRLDCPNVRNARKPAKNGFRRAMAAMGTGPETTAIVGDQMFTDILGGNRLGLLTIMVGRMDHPEFLFTRYFSRPPERLLLRWFKRKGHI